MGCGNTKEKIQSKIVLINVDKILLMEQREEYLRKLELITGQKVKWPEILEHYKTIDEEKNKKDTVEYSTQNTAVCSSKPTPQTKILSSSPPNEIQLKNMNDFNENKQNEDDEQLSNKNEEYEEENEQSNEDVQSNEDEQSNANNKKGYDQNNKQHATPIQISKHYNSHHPSFVNSNVVIYNHVTVSKS